MHIHFDTPIIEYEKQLKYPRINKDSTLTKYLIAICFRHNCFRKDLYMSVYGREIPSYYGINTINNLIWDKYITKSKVGRKVAYNITELGKYHLYKIFGEELNSKSFQLKFFIKGNN